MIRKRFEKAIPRTKPQHTTAVSRVAQGQGMFVSYQSLVQHMLVYQLLFETQNDEFSNSIIIFPLYPFLPIPGFVL